MDRESLEGEYEKLMDAYGRILKVKQRPETPLGVKNSLVSPLIMMSDFLNNFLKLIETLPPKP